jgi:hypothetical protein
MSKLEVEPGASVSVIFDLVSNCSHRFLQFDGTQVLVQKEGGQYHMKGPVVTCGDEVFIRILKALGPVLLSAQEMVKVSIPPPP